MKLSRLRLSQIRRFREPIEISGFQPGLNLFTGPNEAGKSTIVRAIRAAFFERHRSSSIDDLIPQGETPATASPTIEIDFESGGIAHSLTKTFFSKKRCRYVAGDLSLDGEAAEEALATLLGFGYPGRGVSRPENWGIPGLLWVQQGDGQAIAEPVRSAASHLRIALESTVGAVASTAGDEVLDALRSQRNELLTPGTNRPRGDYSETQKALAEVSAGIANLAGQIVAYQADVDRLESLRREQAAEEKARPWEAFATQLAAASRALEDARQLSGRLKQQADQQAAHEVTIASLDQQIRAFAGDREALVQKRAEGEIAVRAATDAVATLALRQDQRRGAQRAREEADRRLKIAERAQARRDQTDILTSAEAEASRLAESLTQAEAAAATLARHQAEVVANHIDDAAYRQLGLAAATLREREITLQAAATTIRLELRPEQAVRIDGRAVKATGEHPTTTAMKIELDGVGTIEVIPGAGEAADLGRQVADAREALNGLLGRIGVASVDEAGRRRQRHDQAVADVRGAGKLLAVLAPDGVDRLREALARASQRQAEARRALEALGQADSDAETGLEHSPAEARARLDLALADEKRIDDDYHEASNAAAIAGEKRDQAARAVADLVARLEAPATRADEEAIRNRLVEARARYDQVGAAIAALNQQLEAARPEILEQDVERLTRSRDQALATHAERGKAISTLIGRLETAGSIGLEEKRADCQAREAALARRLAEIELRARALDLLVRQLETRRQALTARLQAPLQQKLAPYLRLLFPGASLALNDDLTPGELVRDLTATVDFDQLSYGAREQMGLISRLAYADLLKEAGQPTLIVLDDALVHSDAERIEKMHRVLYDAATRHQILIFSYQPERWAALGVPARDIRALAAYIPA